MQKHTNKKKKQIPEQEKLQQKRKTAGRKDERVAE